MDKSQKNRLAHLMALRWMEEECNPSKDRAELQEILWARQMIDRKLASPGKILQFLTEGLRKRLQVIARICLDALDKLQNR